MTHTRPSQVLKIEDEFAAYQFDLAVLTLGRHIEAELAGGKKIEDLLAPRVLKTARSLEHLITKRVKAFPWEIASDD